MHPALVLHCSLSNQAELHAKLTNVGTDTVSDYVLCFSLLAPLSTLSNCHIIDSVGGFSRLQPSQPTPLQPGQSWEFSFTYKQDLESVKADNVAFGPQSAYVEIGPQTYAIQTQPLRFESSQTTTAAVPQQGHDRQLALLPAPMCWQPAEGHTHKLLGFQAPSDELALQAWQKVSALSQRLGVTFADSQGSRIQALTKQPLVDAQASCQDEAYQLRISDEAICLQAHGEQGYFYGFISLLQLHINYDGRLPCGLITDQPRFEWRGQHLDCARQYFQPEQICQTLDLMALIKLNRFHWHAVDDEAFRFELASAPELAATGWRGHQHWLPGVFGGGIGPTGGTYSKQDMQQVLAHARNLHIQVMAEIDLPGHALALTHAMPELQDSDASANPVFSVQGYSNNTITPGLEASVTRLGPMLEELHGLFPDAPLHLGGDEVAAGVWDHSEVVRQLQQEQQLDSQADVQGWYMQQMAQIVWAQQGQVAAWEEAAAGNQGGIGNQALLFAWRSHASGLALARSGKQVVLCPAQNTYLDMSHGLSQQSAGANWAGHVSLEHTTNWQPIPEHEPELAKYIKGIQGALWSETILNFGMLQQALAPRLFGIAEIAWSQDNNKRQGAELIHGVRALYPLLNSIKWQFTHI